VAEVEAKSLAELKQAPSAPQVPFGYMNRQWLELKAQMVEGDEIYAYGSEVEGGMVLIRKGCIVYVLIGWMS
jgi:hypothetical protein